MGIHVSRIPFYRDYIFLIFQHLIRMLYHYDIFEIRNTLSGECIRECLPQDIG